MYLLKIIYVGLVAEISHCDDSKIKIGLQELIYSTFVNVSVFARMMYCLYALKLV